MFDDLRSMRIVPTERRHALPDCHERSVQRFQAPSNKLRLALYRLASGRDQARPIRGGQSTVERNKLRKLIIVGIEVCGRQLQDLRETAYNLKGRLVTLPLILIHTLTGGRRIDPGSNAELQLAQPRRKAGLLQAFCYRVPSCEAIAQSCVLCVVLAQFGRTQSYLNTKSYFTFIGLRTPSSWQFAGPSDACADRRSGCISSIPEAEPSNRQSHYAGLKFPQRSPCS